MELLDQILAVELDPSFWMTWAAEGMRQPLMSALTEESASTTVIMVKM